MAKTPTTEIRTATGAMRVSTPEATALDLVRYVKSAGQLGVLSELSEKLNPARLVEAARAEVELSVVQRLGFLLDRFASPDVAAPLAGWLATKRPRPVPLRPGHKPKVTKKDARWQILVNEHVEVDE